MKTKLYFLLFMLILLSINLVKAQAWSKGKRNGYFKISENVVVSNQYYAPNGSKVKITTIGQYVTTAYAELGISQHFTAIINAPILVNQHLSSIQYRQSGKTEPGDNLNGIGDFDLGLSYGFSQNKATVLSTSLIFGLPLGKISGGKTGILQTGDGEFNQLLRLDVGHSFYPKPVYMSAYSAFNNRTKNFSDEFKYGFEVGFTYKKFTPIFKVNGIKSFRNGLALTSQGNLFANNVEFLSPALELNYLIQPKIVLSLATATAFYGKNVLSAVNYNFGVCIKW